jgi:hypothetical protein
VDSRTHDIRRRALEKIAQLSASSLAPNDCEDSHLERLYELAPSTGHSKSNGNGITNGNGNNDGYSSDDEPQAHVKPMVRRPMHPFPCES